MIRATQVRGHIAGRRRRPTPSCSTFDYRHRRRWAMTGTRGREFLLDLENGVALRGGDALVLDDGRFDRSGAAPEPLLEIRGTDPHHLVRVACISQPPSADADHGQRLADPARSRHRGDGEGARRARDRDRGAVRTPKAAPMPAAATPMRPRAVRTSTSAHDGSVARSWRPSS